MNKRNITILSMIVLAVITRLLPHPPNVAPITGIALFAGYSFNDKRMAFLLPLFCMFITDIFLGFHMIMPFVYLSFMGISYMGINSKKIGNGTILKSSNIIFYTYKLRCLVDGISINICRFGKLLYISNTILCKYNYR